jgi:hypothetical protein
MADRTCGFVGNSDIYGLGIRLGLYFQWAASILSKQFSASPESIRDIIDVDIIFLTAIFISTALLAGGTIGTPYSVEILIMLHIYFGDVYIIFFDRRILSLADSNQSIWGFWLRSTLHAGMAAFALFFWFHGLDLLLPEPCGGSAFLFARVAIDGAARTFFKIAGVANAVLWGLYAILALLPPLWVSMLYRRSRYRPRGVGRKANYNHLRYWLHVIVGNAASRIEEIRECGNVSEANTGANPRRNPDAWEDWENGKVLLPRMRFSRWFFLCVNLGSFIWTIIAVELIIYWNNISAVYTVSSTGQIIPLIIGFGGFWRVLISICVGWTKSSPWNSDYDSYRMSVGRWIPLPFKPVRLERRRSLQENELMSYW